MTDHVHEALRGFAHAHGLDGQTLDALTALVADLLAHEQARIAAAVEGRQVAEAECERLRGALDLQTVTAAEEIAYAIRAAAGWRKALVRLAQETSDGEQ